MPNWCSNELWVTADGVEAQAQLKAFVRKAKSRKSKNHDKTDLSFNKFYPEPKYKNDDEWYEWRISHWGCKWDIDATLESEDEDGAYYVFDTPWAPPIPFIEEVSKMFPLLHFQIKYDEPGMCFMGVAKGSNGNINDDCLNY